MVSFWRANFLFNFFFVLSFVLFFDSLLITFFDSNYSMQPNQTNS